MSMRMDRLKQCRVEMMERMEEISALCKKEGRARNAEETQQWHDAEKEINILEMNMEFVLSDPPYIPTPDVPLQIYKFGACPECLTPPDHMRIGAEDYMFCETHKYAWHIWPYFPNKWRKYDMLKENHRENELKLKECTEVEHVGSHLEVWDKLTDELKEQVRPIEIMRVMEEINRIHGYIEKLCESCVEEFGLLSSRTEIHDFVDRILNHIDKLWTDRGYREKLLRDPEYDEKFLPDRRYRDLLPLQ